MIIGLGSFATLFICLAIGHLIADWLLQTQHQFDAKQGDNKALANHSIVYTFTMCTMMVVFSMLWINRPYPYDKMIYLIFRDMVIASIFFVSHYYLDSYKIIYLWRKMMGGKWKNFNEFKLESAKNCQEHVINIIIDQTFHIFIILLISLFIFANNYGVIINS